MRQAFPTWTKKTNKDYVDFLFSHFSFFFFFLRQADNPSGMQEAGSEWQKKKKGRVGYLQHNALGKIYPW